MKTRPHSSPIVTTNGIGKPAKGELLFKGRRKNYYSSTDVEFIIQEFSTNGAEAACSNQTNTNKKSIVVVNTDILCYLFNYLGGYYIPTHYVQRISETDVLVRRLEIFPLIVKVFNNAVGTLPKRFGLKEGAALEFPIIEYYYKNTSGSMPWVNEYHLYSFCIASPEEVKQINRITSKVNAVLRSLCARRQLELHSMQLEFGRANGQVYLADELSPYTCYFSDSATLSKAARTRFIANGNENVEAFVELFERLSMNV